MEMELRVVFMQLFIELTEFVEELFIGLSEFELIKSVPSTD